MTENLLKKPEKPKKERKNQGDISRFFSSMLDGTILTREKTGSLLTFSLFLASLALALIFNTYYAEKKARELESLRVEIVELRLRYITTKSELMALSNQSEMARRLVSRGLVESKVPPKQIPGTHKKDHTFSNLFKRK